MIEPGKKAPAFTLEDQDGTTHSLKDLAGQPVVLYFYPKDDTTGCTAESCQFRDMLPSFKRSKAVVLGMSPQDTKSKAKFAEKYDLNFPILADVKLNKDDNPAICDKYGVWVEKSMYGRTYMGVQRTTYLIDAEGKVARRWDKVKVPGHADEVLEAVREL